MKAAGARLVPPAIVLLLLSTPLATAAVGPAYAGLGEHVQDGVLCSSIAVVTLAHEDGLDSTELTPGVHPAWVFSAWDRRCIGEFATFLDRECVRDSDGTLRCWAATGSAWQSLNLTLAGELTFERGGVSRGTVTASMLGVT